MLACVDVDYRARGAVAACLLFRAWSDAAATDQFVEAVAEVEPYLPGQFYRRELPCLLAVLAKVKAPLDVVVVDGHVWLGSDAQPGLGAHLYEALGRRVAVVGVAKQPFRAGCGALPVARGASARPLYVTAAGIEPAVAAAHVRAMHGAARIPTLLRAVDRLCRAT